MEPLEKHYSRLCVKLCLSVGIVMILISLVLMAISVVDLGFYDLGFPPFPIDFLVVSYLKLFFLVVILVLGATLCIIGGYAKAIRED